MRLLDQIPVSLHDKPFPETGDGQRFPASRRGLLRSPLFLATIAIWLLSFIVWSLQAAALDLPRQLEIGARGVGCDALGAGFCGGIYLVLKRLERRALVVQLLAALALTVVATAAFMVLLFAAYHTLWPIGPAHPGWLVDHMDTLVAILWTFLAWCSAYFSLNLGAALREAEIMALDAENRMLRYQLDPHFLFNIHNALATLIHDHRNSEAERMVLRLSAFLRRSLAKDPSALVKLAEEADAMHEYMSIEAARFGDRLRFIETVDPALDAALVPSLILQPLLENATKHGLGHMTGEITVELGAARVGQKLTLWVEDDGAGSGAPADGALGVGLENVSRRLQTLYGQGASVTTQKRSPSGFKVTLQLPLVFA